MKKLVLVAIMLLVPFTSFALDAMTDADLDEMTAQAGVTIGLSDLQITTNAADSAWGDMNNAEDGYAWIAQDAETTTQIITINGAVKIDVMNATDVAATFGDLGDYGITAATAVVIDVNLAITNEGGTTQTLELNATSDVAVNDGNGLNAAAIMGDTGATGLDSTSTLGTQYSASANQSIDGTILIMAH